MRTAVNAAICLELSPPMPAGRRVRMAARGETPIAVIVIKTGHATTEGEILDWCNARLGKQQRLADVKFVTEIPRNPNGKILKRQLRANYKDKVYD